MRAVLAIDEGTTGVRAYVFDRECRVLGQAYAELTTAYPQAGWVEQDPLALWEQTLEVSRAALACAGVQAAKVAAIGVCTQRATTLVWERATGQPVYPAIVWQDTRTAQRAAELVEQGVITTAMASATKLEWILDRSPELRRRGERGELCFGTVDSWLVWNLTGGSAHVTDHSNASCTTLYDPFQGTWWSHVLEVLRIPPAVLPRICSSSEVYGFTSRELFGAAIPVASIAGDQQAAMFGELCWHKGGAKITLGTSGMADVHTGSEPAFSPHGAYPLVLWSLAGERAFCLEGTVIAAGAAIQWLRDGLGILERLDDAGALARSVADSGGVWAVPAFQGLGTPHIAAAARAVIGGLSRASSRAHIVRAMLEGIAFRCREVLSTLFSDAGAPFPERLRVDGGAAANDFLLQCLADVLGCEVERPASVQASVLGAAFLAGLTVGFWATREELRQHWRSGGVFVPQWATAQREERFARWQRCLQAAQLGPL
ncbi:MAG: glycerol kinase GlpK [Candidatus Binatia bacterium]|nr:glycerol kinase GlpK [Candidatus Binatia bacterium]